MNLKDLKKDLKIYDSIDFKSFDNNALYFDVGYGEKFLIIYLNLKNLNTLRDFASYQVFKEIFKRFIDISNPVGFRTRFMISLNQGIFSLEKHIIELLGKKRILDIIILDSVGVGNEKIVANYLNDYKVKKIKRIIENFGLDIDLIIDKEWMLDDIDIDCFIIKSFPNTFLKKLDKTFYNERLRDKSVFSITTILKKLY